jgi:hypothetical protein
MNEPMQLAVITFAMLTLVGVAVALLILRRSLIGAAVAVGIVVQGLGWGAATAGRTEDAVVIVVVGVVVASCLAAAAIAVHRRRGLDHVDELRELQG